MITLTKEDGPADLDGPSAAATTRPATAPATTPGKVRQGDEHALTRLAVSTWA
ncbi:hypothetical protein [Streptomyces sp. NPDC051909]|uniref:hypothetical protein n=1 Tax=Streptomyces sp. NPDC051909 TaxID=3154944 RepID=UPI0034232CCA